MANNLKDHLKEVADAIRAKKGTSDLINPQDFATEIEGITSGSAGGESVEGGTLTYLIPHAEYKEAFIGYGYLAKLQFEGVTTIYAGYLVAQQSLVDYVVAVAMDLDAELTNLADPTRSISSFRNILAGQGINVEDIADIITKEQFYDLNA